MKSTQFWVRRFLMVWGASALFLLAVYAIRGYAWDHMIREAAAWSLMATSIFIAGRYYNASKGKPCAMCRDTVEE